jgi:hypothetical protein
LRRGEVLRDEFVAVGGESADGLLVFDVGFVAGNIDRTPWGEKAVVDNEVAAGTDAGTQGAYGVLLITEDSPDGDHQGDVERVALLEPTAQVPTMELASVTEAFLFGATSALFDKRREGIHGNDVEAEPFGQCEGDDTLAAAEVKGAGSGRQFQGLQNAEHFVGRRRCPVGQQFGKEGEKIGRRFQGFGNLSVDVLGQRTDNSVWFAVRINGVSHTPQA